MLDMTLVFAMCNDLYLDRQGLSTEWHSASPCSFRATISI